MRLVPDTLFGRLVAALLTVVALTVLIVALLIVRERRDLAFWNSTTSELVGLIAATSEELAGLPDGERGERLAELRASVLAVDRDVASVPPPRRKWHDAAAARSYEKRLRRALGSGYDVAVKPARLAAAGAVLVGDRRWRMPPMDGRPSGGSRLEPGESPGGPPRPGAESRRQLDVTVRLPNGEPVVFRIASPPPAVPLPRGIFAELGVLTVVLVAVLFLMARTITHPLSALAGAAEAMGRGRTPPPLPESGARELREATRAFNTMHERLKRYLDSRTQLLAAMSHDLRTPLTRLRLRVEYLDDPKLKERFSADLDEMNQMVTGALGLFRGLDDDEPVQPADVRELFEELRSEFAELGEDVKIEGDPGPAVTVKRLALKRCLANLISNAVKFGFRATVVAEGGAALTIIVRDEGPGIPEESLERVFQPFYRLEGSRNADTGGTGLGLSIARDIAQLLGGSLDLRNRRAGGLEAILTLPRARNS